MDEQKQTAFVERMFNTGLAGMDMLTVYLGTHLGLYAALRGGARTPAEVAARTGVDERYAREWLEQQAVSGIIEAEVTEGGATFRLSPEHAEVLLEEQSLNYLAPLMRLVVGAASQLPALAEAYRTGGGVSWASYGADVIEGQGQFNRPAFERLLASEWLPSIPGLVERLRQPGARVADVACGLGWSSLAMATAFPALRVDGYDFDKASIAAAVRAAAERGLADRVRFSLADISDGAVDGQYDLVTVFEALHDMARPVEALRAMRGLCKPDGQVLVMDERVAETFSGAGDDIERMMYGWSVLLCLTNSLAESPSAATGTVMRESTLRRYASEAGFASVETPGIENDFFRFYLLTP